MLAHQLISPQIANPVIERRRAFEVGKEEGQAFERQPQF
jgi:hypothetical protein